MSMGFNNRSVLLEIGTEEMPARFIPQAISDLRAISKQILSDYRVEHGDINVYATPRRLAVIINSISPMQKDQVREVFGPSKKAAFDEQGNPTRAAVGFASSLGIDTSKLKIKLKGKGEYVVAVIEEKGVETKSILPEILKKIIMSLHFPKAMRWGNGSITFVRPIAWILAILGSEAVEFEIDGIKSGNLTKGHRFLSPAAFKIIDVSAYKQFLETNYVILDQEKRQDIIIKSMLQLVKEPGATIIQDDALLETVNYLVEFPVAVLCSFDAEYLQLPKELLVTVMKDHQKYFAIQDSEGRLLNSFIAISNTKAENADIVRTGAQRVIKARFDDAKFYYADDISKTLESRVKGLGEVTFHDRLGSLLDKTSRIEAIASFIAAKVAPDIKEAVVRAARLSKADLISGVVREFPELQGIMGRYYAYNDKEAIEVCEALKEQYLPKSFGDDIPKTDHGAILSISDRVDNLTSFFSIGQIPTGSEDPFALRRQAMGIISILIAKGYDISLKELFECSLGIVETGVSKDMLMDNITSFMAQRTEFILSSAGYDQEIIKSVLRHSFTEPLHSIPKRMDALSSMRKETGFMDYILAVKRVNNIVPKTALQAVREPLFMQDEERDLYSSLMTCRAPFVSALKSGNFNMALQQLMTLTPFINGFFDKVLVMEKDEDVKNNRLSLLKEIWETVSLLADFSKFQS